MAPLQRTHSFTVILSAAKKLNPEIRDTRCEIRIVGTREDFQVADRLFAEKGLDIINNLSTE
jgi:hypothetical protein